MRICIYTDFLNETTVSANTNACHPGSRTGHVAPSGLGEVNAYPKTTNQDGLSQLNDSNDGGYG